MAKLFGKKPEHLSQKDLLETKYNSSISNLLLVVIFSTVNILLLVLNAGTYFLFSAYIPYFLADFGMYFSGAYPAEYYADIPDMDLSGGPVWSLLIVCLAIAAVIILLYLLCWFLAKKKKAGWLITATVLFCIDTVIMFLLTGINTGMIVDIIFHAWVIFSLISGIINLNKWKSIPDAKPEEAVEETTEETAEKTSETETYIE